MGECEQTWYRGWWARVVLHRLQARDWDHLAAFMPVSCYDDDLMEAQEREVP